MTIQLNIDNPSLLAEQALAHTLYVPRWSLRNYLERIQRTNKGKIVLWLNENQTPVGVAIISVMGQVMTFVHPDYRRQGIGSKMVAALLQAYPCNTQYLFGDYGVAGSLGFWKHNGIAVGA